MAILRPPAPGLPAPHPVNVRPGKSCGTSPTVGRLILVTVQSARWSSEKSGIVLLVKVARARTSWVTFAESKAFPLVGPIVSRPSR